MSRRQAVGFDRPIDLSWLDAVAAKVAEGASPPEVRKFLYSVLEGAVSGDTKNSARGKTVTVLSHIWCLIPERATSLRGRAVERLGRATTEERLAIHWAMMIGTYPFFTDTASAIGRLLSLHGSVAVSQLKRRLAETWGERSTIARAIPRIVRSMVEWGVLKDTGEKGVYAAAGDPSPVSDPVAELLVEALLIDSDQESMEVAQLLGHAALFPLRMPASAHKLRGAAAFEVHRQGMDQEVLALIGRKAANSSRGTAGQSRPC
jgi:hypothetical protein